MRQITSSTLSNQSLATALNTHTYTADADRLLFVRVFADQVAGAGDYVAYLTVQRLSAGSAYRVVPITTATVASGVTSVMLTTIGVPVKNTDVVKVYLTGLAGDTTTPDIITEIWEDELFITVGAAGAGLTAVGDTAGTTTLLSRLSSARAGYLDNLSAGAVALQSTLTTVAGYIDTEVATIITNIAALPAAVWDRLTTALTTSGSIGAWILANAGSGASPATFWAYASRTLTMGASSIISAVTGDRLTAYVGAYTSITLTGLTDFTGYKRIYFTVKSNPREDADSDSILQIRKSNPANGTDDGLLYIAGAAGTKAHGSITVNSTTSITIIVLNAAAALWESGQFSYDVWYIGSDDQPRPASEGGSFDIVDAVSRAAS